MDIQHPSVQLTTEDFNCGCGRSFRRQGDFTHHLMNNQMLQGSILHVTVDEFSIDKTILCGIQNTISSTLSRGVTATIAP